MPSAIAMPALSLALLALAFPPLDDARLAVRATLERPRVTYGEFGAWVQNRTHVPIQVSTALRDRKATVLVADRPVAETMARFADAFLLEWEPAGTGYRLRLLPKVSTEEGEALEREAQARTAAFREAIAAITALGQMTTEAIEAAEGEAAESGPGAQTRAFLVARYGHEPAALIAGELLTSLSPDRRAAVLAGARAFGSSRGETGPLALSRRWLPTMTQQFESMGPGGMEGDDTPKKPIENLFVTIKGDPAKTRLRISASATTKEGESRFVMNTNVEGSADDAEDGPLDARLKAWAETDDALLATKLAKSEGPLAVHASARHTLADLLASLHRRSGLPIVADGFRDAASDGRAPDGPNLRAWLKALASPAMAGGPSYLARTKEGWLMLRRSKYWRRFAEEPLESAILPLERARPTLDGVAAFASTVTPVQEEHLDAQELVMDFPNVAVDGKIPFLRLWASLSASSRRRATDDELPFADLSGDAARLALELLDDFGGPESPSDAILPYLMPGGPSLPKELALSVKSQAEMTDFEFPPPNRVYDPRAPQASPIERRYRGYLATVSDSERTFSFYEFPLQEKPTDPKRP